MSRRFALIVGVNQYQDATFPPLQFAENDARALAQWLVNEKGGKWLPSDVQFVQGTHATRGLIESLLNQLCLMQAGPDDLVLFYFAGHGFLDERSGAGSLALSDTRYTQPETALQLALLAQRIMTKSNAARILFMLDTFQFGPFWSTLRTSPFDMQPLLGRPMIQGLAQLTNRVVICSCRGNEQAPETSERGLGPLMYRTIIGLSGQAQDQQTGVVSLQSLYSYLSDKLSQQQQPQVFGQAQGPFVLVGSEQPSVNSFAPTAPASPTSSTYSAQGREQGSFAVSATQTSSVATATAQLSPSTYSDVLPSRTTSGYLASSPIAQQRLQQGQMLIEQSQQALQMQQLPQALSLVNQALQIIPDDIAALTLKTQILGTAGQTQEALVTAEQLIQRDSLNPLAWSMKAVILTNAGQHKTALEAIERALELDASNPETYAIKTNIMSNLAMQESQGKAGSRNALIQSEQQRPTPRSFFIALGLQIVGVLMGVTGGLLPILRPTLPLWLAFLLEGFSLSLLCVNSTRGTYRHGFLHLLPTLFSTLLLVGVLGVCLGYKTVYRKIIFELQAHTNFLLPLLFLAGWIVLAALVPFVLALIGLGVRLISGSMRRKK